MIPSRLDPFQGDPVGDQHVVEAGDLGHGTTQIVRTVDALGDEWFSLVCDVHQWASHPVTSRVLLDGDDCAKCLAERDGGDARYSELHRALSVAGHRAG